MILTINLNFLNMFILNICQVVFYKLKSFEMNLSHVDFVGYVCSILFIHVLCNFGLQTYFESEELFIVLFLLLLLFICVFLFSSW